MILIETDILSAMAKIARLPLLFALLHCFRQPGYISLQESSRRVDAQFQPEASVCFGCVCLDRS